MTMEAQKIRLIMELRSQGITDTKVLGAIERIPREAFVPKTFRDRSYENVALPIGHGQTISQPAVVGYMTQELEEFLLCNPKDPANAPGGPGMLGTCEELQSTVGVINLNQYPVFDAEFHRYALIGFDDTPRSPAGLWPEGTVVTTGLSKHLSLGGWRVGFGFVPRSQPALVDALRYLQRGKLIADDPLLQMIASVSVGVYQGVPVLDLDYPEDSAADTDMNVIMGEDGGFIEVQGTAEGAPFQRAELDAMLDLAGRGVRELIARQKEALAG